MTDITPKSVIERYRHAKEQRGVWESHWQECYDYALPQRDGIIRQAQPGEKKTDKLFDGTIWTGRKAVELGLADGVGNLHGVLREKFGEKLRLRPIKVARGWLQKRFGMNHGSEIVTEVLGAIEERAIWGRFGL